MSWRMSEVGLFSYDATAPCERLGGNGHGYMEESCAERGGSVDRPSSPLACSGSSSCSYAGGAWPPPRCA